MEIHICPDSIPSVPLGPQVAGWHPRFDIASDTQSIRPACVVELSRRRWLWPSRIEQHAIVNHQSNAAQARQGTNLGPDARWHEMVAEPASVCWPSVPRSANLQSNVPTIFMGRLSAMSVCSHLTLHGPSNLTDISLNPRYLSLSLLALLSQIQLPPRLQITRLRRRSAPSATRRSSGSRGHGTRCLLVPAKQLLAAFAVHHWTVTSSFGGGGGGASSSERSIG